MKEAHDRQGVGNKHYSTGQLVWLSTKHISLRHPSLRHKFSPKFIGPVKVLESSQIGSTVLLELPSNVQIHPRVSVTLAKLEAGTGRPAGEKFPGAPAGH